MKRFLLSIVVLVFVITACDNQKNVNTGSANTEDVKVEEIALIDLNDFDNQAAEFVQKQVKFSGTVDHVCKHGGQKMFVVTEESDARVKIVTGENMAAFNTELEGETVNVVGIVDELRIDEEYLREWEEELNNDIEEENEAMHTGEKKGDAHEGDHDEDHSNAMKQINNLRTQLIESGKDHLSFYSIICVEYEVVTTEEEEPTV
jgi:hypothetical protein